MGIRTMAAQAWRDFVNDGVPASGVHNPAKADVRRLFEMIEVLLNPTAISNSVTAQPVSPEWGQLYIIPADATGAAWELMQENSIAAFLSNGWVEIAPKEGTICSVISINMHLCFQSGEWTPLPGAGALLAENALSELAATVQTALTNLGFGANARSLVGAANFAAMRALLDLEPGVDFVAYSSFSTNGRSLVSAANYAAMRALLDLEAGTDFYSKAAADGLFVTFGGGTLTGALTLNADPTNALHAATKQYVDNIAAGFDVKGSVKAATTANITLSGAQTIDGISCVAGDRVLVKNQSSAQNNGIYVVASGSWTRATDMDNWNEVPGANVWVEQGSTNGDRAFVCTSDAGGTLNTTAITWTQFGGTGAYQAASANLSTWAGIAPSANVQSFCGAADYAAMRTLLGLVIGTNVQAYSANLTTFAGIAPSANVQTLLGAANFAAVRTSLGLVVGTDVQAYSANLVTYAGIAPSANVQTLLGAANYSAFRTSLGVAIGSNVQAWSAKLDNLAASSGVTGTITVSTSDPSGGADGDIWLKREA